MTNNIFIPDKINVGFQNRSDTYTGKLAYIIYFDETGKLRKEVSWDNWRDQSIANEIYDNEPTEGFVLNKNAGGVENSWYYNVRKTYCRVYDPRGFEFEITIPNLLYILQNCTCTKGKGLEGEFVYGWDGTDLVLLPTSSPDYSEIVKHNEVLHITEYIKAKDLKIGATYETKKGDQYVYLGKFDFWKKEFCYKKEDESWHKRITNARLYDNHNILYERYIKNGKAFFFYKANEKYFYIYPMKSISKKFVNMISEKTDKYPEYYEKLQCNDEFSPLDYSSCKLLQLPYENFCNAINKSNYCVDIGHIHNNCFTLCRVFKKSDYYEYFNYSNSKYENVNTLEDLYNELKPVYGVDYLMNGKEFRRIYYHE